MTVRNYVELCKLRIGFMVALTAMAGYAAIAPTVQALPLLLLGLAMLLGSAASSVFNHYYDRDMDRLMKRTMSRPLAADEGNATAALWFAGALLVAGLTLALAVFNWVVAAHLFLGAFVYGVVYTVWLKRRTWLNIVIGGAAGSFAVLAGGAAVDPSQWVLPSLMAVVLFLWTPSHFWALAMLLREDYARAGVPMLPVVVGPEKCARAILTNSLLLVASSLLPLVFTEMGWIYGGVAAVFGARFLWVNVQLLRDPSTAWARRTFLGSMQYLAGVFLAVLLDKHLPFEILS